MAAFERERMPRGSAGAAAGEKAQAGAQQRRAAKPSSARGIFRVPIALKLALFMALLTVAFMSWQTYVAIGVATQGLEKEINRSGSMLVTAVATLIEPTWVLDANRRKDMERVLSQFSNSPGTAQVRNIVVYSREAALATARMETRFVRTEGRRVDDADSAAAQVEIREFSYEGTPVRSFSRPILLGQSEPLGDGAAGLSSADTTPRASPGSPAVPREPVGHVELYISARAIQDSRARLSNALVGVSAAACSAAALGAFLLAGFLTRPIRVLVKDMKQVALGHLDHKSSVGSSDEIGDLAHAFNSMTEGLEAAQEARVAQRTLQHDLSLAAKIQGRLLPSSVPSIPGFEVGLRYASAKEVSGDYHDFIPIDEDHVGIVVADVSGKGVPASLVMTMTRSLLRMAAREEIAPDRVLRQVNRCLTPDMNPGMFVTLLYMVLDTKSRELLLVRAGHNPPFLFASRQGRLVRIQPRGMAIGLDRQGSLFEGELQAQRVPLQTGDVLVAYTDGIVEAKNSKGEDFSEDRLLRVVEAGVGGTAQSLVDSVIQAVQKYRQSCEQSDDITILALKATVVSSVR